MAFIEARGLSKSFAASGRATRGGGRARGMRHVLANVSLDVERGEFVSLVGAMGSGKSTLLSLLAGLTAPDSGTITIDGQPVTGIRGDAAMVFQNYSLLPWFTSLENVRLAVQASFPDLSAADQTARAEAALLKVGLGSALHRRPSQLSGGMRQRVALARALSTEPQVLFLDEPFGALDALTRENLQKDLLTLCASGAARPVTTVMITNSVEEAILLSDRIVPLIPGPPAGLGTPVSVDLDRPRHAAQLAHDEHASHVRAHVVATLTASQGRRSGGARTTPTTMSARQSTLAHTPDPIKSPS
jgi:nitrate/nitrite transport system ATP-binding protein